MQKKTQPTPQARPEEKFLRPQDLRRLQNFQFAARLMVEGVYAGRHRSPYYDASAEFADYRPYVPGDELRALDWRAYARTDRDYIKLFRKESDMRCHVLLDCSRSMGFRDSPEQARADSRRGGLLRKWLRPAEDGSDAAEAKKAGEEGLSKFEYGAYLTAALCYLMVQQGDKASLALGASQLQTFVPPGGTISHLYRLLHALERMQTEGQTDLATVLRTLFTMVRRRGMLVVISDFLEPPDALFAALAMFVHRGWQILLFHVLTETEITLPGDGGPLRYHDAESAAIADADPDALRTAYRSELQVWLDDIETQAKARGIRYALLSTATPYERSLERYLTLRARA